MSKKSSVVLIGAGAWNWVIWPRFWTRIYKDERSFDDYGSPTKFLKVHACLIGTSLALGTVTSIIGVRGLRRR